MLRIRTGYSFRNAAGHLNEVIERLKEIGSEYAPITDRASTFAWARWKKLALAAGLRPVFGVELAVTNGELGTKAPVDYWLFISSDAIGPINRLVELATSQFYYQPLLTVQQAFEAADRDVAVVMGTKPQGIDWSTPIPNVYLGIGPGTVRGLANQAIRGGWNLVATGNNSFTNKGDSAFYQTLVGRNANVSTYPQHILSWEEWSEYMTKVVALPPDVLEQAWSNSLGILASSTATLERATLPTPHRPGTLREMCEEGADIVDCDLRRPEYAARLDRELELITQKGYEDYFYIVADLVQWARANMMVGPARGSSCGSLVCYLLRITTVDPIPFGLIFERFVDINRTDMPDIDIDFSDQQRHRVFEYLSKRYSPERVARLGAVSMYKAKSALAEVALNLRIPKWEADAVGDSIIERSSGDARALLTLKDTMTEKPVGQQFLRDHPEAEIVTRFEGHPRHYTQHAAGVVLASEPISNFVAMDYRTGAVMCDKKDAEAGYNLLKIDALGLTQLSVFEDCLVMAGLPPDKLEKLPLNDKLAFDVLNEQRFSGIFQFNGQALQSLVKQFTVNCFNDIASTNALARPGPMGNGGALEWVKRRNGSLPITYPHPIFKPYMEDTQGVVLYQEQVMQIGREIGSLSWGQVSELRKAMSQSLGKEYFDKFGDPWKKAAISRGVDAKLADKLWDDLCSYGAMSFNKSHSVCYGMISYWCCWLKAYYPLEFAAATLSHEAKPERQIEILREMNAEGIEYLPFNEANSSDKWVVGERGDKRLLVGPLSSIKGVGPRMISQAMSARSRGEPLPTRLLKLMTNATTSIDSLWPIRDAFNRILPDPAVRGIHKTIRRVETIFPEFEDQLVYIFVVLAKINLRDEHEPINVGKRLANTSYTYKGMDPKTGLYLDGKHYSLLLQMRDDTGMIRGKISRDKYAELAPEIESRGRVGKALYCIRAKQRGHYGKADEGFRYLMIDGVRYIGDMDQASPVVEMLEAAE